MRISDWSSDVCSSDLAGPPRPVPAAAASFGHRLAGDFPRLCAVPGRLAVAGGDAAGGAGVPVAHPGRGAGAARGVPEALCSVCARDETAGPVRLVTPAFVGAHLGAPALSVKPHRAQVRSYESGTA